MFGTLIITYQERPSIYLSVDQNFKIMEAGKMWMPAVLKKK